MIRELITKINRSLSEKLVSARRHHTAPIKIWFDPDMNTDRHREAAFNACVLGETVDLSRSGIGFLVPAIRVKEKYLVGQDRNLNVEIDLPNGKVRLRLIGRRYEKVGIHLSMERYLVGAQIVGYEDGSDEAYGHFLKHGRKARKAAGSLELGID